MGYIVGIDVGGTFTDAFAADETGRAFSAKAPSTPPDFSRGVLDALHEVSAQLGMTMESLLSETHYICHGTTASLNALVTGSTAKVGFITTQGHRDSIYIMNIEGRYAGLGPDKIQDFTGRNKPPPLLPHRLVKEVTERIDYKGAIVVPLFETEAKGVIQELVDEGVEAIAVSLLWSFLNPIHERRIRELIHAVAPRLYVGLSSEISPRIREYARSVTTIMSSQVAPILRDYLSPLDHDLKGANFKGPLLVMQSLGGSISAADAPNYAISTIGSVLTGGVIGALNLAEVLGHRNIISTDMGGTTFLVGLIVDGKPVTSTTTFLNQYTLNLPMLRVECVGSGGGAIAWIDQGGNLRVGPKSAGAVPGPACYGQGGMEPTVTDTDLVLGILNPDFFLGGRKKIRKDLAEQAIQEKIARPLGLSIEDAAAAIFSIQNAQTADLVRKVVVAEGHDPRDFVLYSFGGAGPVHAFSYGVDLGIKEVVVPLGSTAATFSAYGLAAADMIISAELSDPANFPIEAAKVNENFTRLEADVSARVKKQGVPFSSISMQREIDIRYTLQYHEVSTPVRSGILSDKDVIQIANDFERRYENLYGKGSGFRDAGIQFITYRVNGIAQLPFKPRLPAISVSEKGTCPPPKGTRRVFLDRTRGWEPTPIYDYAKLAFGHRLNGPCVVEAPTTTVVVPPDASGDVDQFGNIVISFDAGGK
jgi:N-methylhydantoinase A